MSKCRSIFRGPASGNEKNHELLRGIKRVFFVNHKLQSKKKKNGRHSSSDQGGGSTHLISISNALSVYHYNDFCYPLVLDEFPKPAAYVDDDDGKESRFLTFQGVRAHSKGRPF